MSDKMSRRSFLGKAAIGATGLALGDLIGMTTARAVSQPAGKSSTEGSKSEIVPFHGPHQAGVLTPQQNCINIAAFDVTASSAADLKKLLQAWTELSDTMTRGEPIGGAGEPDPQFQPPDTGEQLGLSPAKLTITFGFGAQLFDKAGEDRFGLRSRMPKGLKPMPIFHRDSLKPELTHGDIIVQACADDPVVCFHAIRNLANAARGTAFLRWQQTGQLGVNSQGTNRNLFGFKDGTANPDVNDEKFMNRNIWLQDGDDAPWTKGGTFMAVRRIQMHMETWDQLTFATQEGVIGRKKQSGAPKDGKDEFDFPGFAGDPDGKLTPLDSHIRLSNPRSGEDSERERILRRGYNFMEGLDSVGRMNAGLVFVCFNRNLQTQFESINKRLTDSKMPDQLLSYTQTTGGGYFFIPPGVTAKDGFIGEGLFA